MMFRGTFGSEIYRAVRDLLHEQVSLGHGHPPRGHRQAVETRSQRDDLAR
ncbi:hypothetical protein [Roseateles sp. P5_E1]